MLALSSKQNYFMFYGRTDFRKGFDGLSGIVTNMMKLDPTSGDIFVFVNSTSPSFTVEAAKQTPARSKRCNCR